MPISRHHRHEIPVVWTRGPGCRELAEILGGSSATPVRGNPADTCIDHGALLLVARRSSSFDLCSVAVPHGFDAQQTDQVVAAVGRGPHSPLAAAVALRVAGVLDVPVRGLYVHREAGPMPPLRRTLPTVVELFPDLPVETVHAATPAEVVRSLPAGTLLVTGAPGGSWLQRQFFGPGARLLQQAPNGTIVVRLAPRRVYQVMEPPTAYGPQLRVADARALGLGDIVIASGGTPLGAVSAADLAVGRADEPLAGLVRDLPRLRPEEPVGAALERFERTDLTVLPVVDGSGRLVGVLRRADTRQASLPWAG